ncbi:MAG: hypothetical protein C5B47_05705 [Verrucomicrobia bacterium]|nr:MAG: hypothetical protein C5B47_05705 [Verrucomicrobiota bacterium]
MISKLTSPQPLIQFKVFAGEKDGDFREESEHIFVQNSEVSLTDSSRRVYQYQLDSTFDTPLQKTKLHYTFLTPHRLPSSDLASRKSAFEDGYKLRFPDAQKIRGAPTEKFRSFWQTLSSQLPYKTGTDAEKFVADLQQNQAFPPQLTETDMAAIQAELSRDPLLPQLTERDVATFQAGLKRYQALLPQLTDADRAAFVAELKCSQTLLSQLSDTTVDEIVAAFERGVTAKPQTEKEISGGDKSNAPPQADEHSRLSRDQKIGSFFRNNSHRMLRKRGATDCTYCLRLGPLTPEEQEKIEMLRSSTAADPHSDEVEQAFKDGLLAGYDSVGRLLIRTALIKAAVVAFEKVSAERAVKLSASSGSPGQFHTGICGRVPE